MTKIRKILLVESHSPGDILTMTRALADLKLSYPRWKIDVESPCPEIFKNNPHITPLDKNDPDLETIKVKYDSINESGQRGHHFTDAFRDDMEKQLKVKIKKNVYKP